MEIIEKKETKIENNDNSKQEQIEDYQKNLENYRESENDMEESLNEIEKERKHEDNIFVRMFKRIKYFFSSIKEKREYKKGMNELSEVPFFEDKDSRSYSSKLYSSDKSEKLKVEAKK